MGGGGPCQLLPAPSCCIGPELPSASSRRGRGWSTGQRDRCGCLPWASTWHTAGAFIPGGVCL